MELNKDTMSLLKEKNKQLEAELLSLVEAPFLKEMEEREKTHGSISKEIEGIKLTYEVKQTVTWDQERLQTLLENLPMDVGSKLIKIEYSVSEAVFKNQVDPGLIDALIDARTTKLSAPAIKLR
jgi:hypothetical protein